jgi:hypothetical protein
MHLCQRAPKHQNTTQQQTGHGQLERRKEPDERIAHFRKGFSFAQRIEWHLGVRSYGLRRQAERDAALDQTIRLGCPYKSIVATALCQRSPKAVASFMLLL